MGKRLSKEAKALLVGWLSTPRKAAEQVATVQADNIVVIAELFQADLVDLDFDHDGLEVRLTQVGIERFTVTTKTIIKENRA